MHCFGFLVDNDAKVQSVPLVNNTQIIGFDRPFFVNSLRLKPAHFLKSLPNYASFSNQIRE
jgi:hypothetical protein